MFDLWTTFVLWAAVNPEAALVRVFGALIVGIPSIWLCVSGCFVVLAILARLVFAFGRSLLALGSIIWWLVSWLFAPAQRYMLNRSIRRKIWHRVRESVPMNMIGLDGTLKFDSRGPYVLVDVGGKEYAVRLRSQAELATFLSSPPVSPTNGSESLMTSSVSVAAKPPPFQFSFVVGGKIVGTGFRAGSAKEDYLWTAAHVISSVMTSGADFSLVAGGKELVIDAEMREHFKTAIYTSELDTVAFQVPQAVFGSLGLSRGKFVKSSLNVASRVYGMVNGENVFNTGVSTKARAQFRLSHSCSTVPGMSGAPLLTTMNGIFGLHVQGFEKHNVAVSFDWYLPSKAAAESDFNVQAFHNDQDVDDYDEIAEDERWEARVSRMLGEEVEEISYFGTRNHYGTYDRMEEDTVQFRQGRTLGSWTDDEEMDWDAPALESVFQERSKSKGKERVMRRNTLVPASVNISGMPTKNEESSTQVMVSVLEKLDAIANRLVILESATPAPLIGSSTPFLNCKVQNGPISPVAESSGPSKSTPADISSGPKKQNGTPIKKKPTKKSAESAPLPLPTPNLQRATKKILALLSAELREPLQSLLQAPDALAPEAVEKAICFLVSDLDHRKVLLDRRSQIIVGRSSKGTPAN